MTMPPSFGLTNLLKFLFLTGASFSSSIGKTGLIESPLTQKYKVTWMEAADPLVKMSDSHKTGRNSLTCLIAGHSLRTINDSSTRISDDAALGGISESSVGVSSDSLTRIGDDVGTKTIGKSLTIDGGFLSGKSNNAKTRKIVKSVIGASNDSWTVIKEYSFDGIPHDSLTKEHKNASEINNDKITVIKEYSFDGIPHDSLTREHKNASEINNDKIPDEIDTSLSRFVDDSLTGRVSKSLIGIGEESLTKTSDGYLTANIDSSLFGVSGNSLTKRSHALLPAMLFNSLKRVPIRSITMINADGGKSVKKDPCAKIKRGPVMVQTRGPMKVICCPFFTCMNMCFRYERVRRGRRERQRRKRMKRDEERHDIEMASHAHPDDAQAVPVHQIMIE